MSGIIDLLRHVTAVAAAALANLLLADAVIETVRSDGSLRSWAVAHLTLIRVPLLFQLALLAGAVALGLALMTSLRASVRQPVAGARGRSAFEAVALTTALALLAALLPAPPSAITSPTVVATGSPLPESGISQNRDDRLALVENGLRALEDGIRDAPRDRWDPEQIVSQFGGDPEQLSGWVRDHTAWIPYRGVLRGAMGVLMDRQGNSADRAVLLATLLQQAGHTVRLARGELTRPEALKLLPALVEQRIRRGSVTLDPELLPETDISAVAPQYAMDGARVRQAIERQEDQLTQLLTDLERRVADHTARLLSAVTPPDAESEWLARSHTALEALRDHWWVQREEHGVWLDVDVLGDGAPATPVRAQSTTTVSDIPSSLRHEVALRVVLEHWSGGSLTREPVLEHALRPSELFGQRVVLQFWPARWPAQIHPDPQSSLGLRGVALEQQEWTAVLHVGREAVAQAVVRATAAGGLPATTNPFGGIGAAIGANRPSSPASQLTAAWIEYDIRAPGARPHTIRREVFDLLGPAARSAAPVSRLSLTDAQRLARSLSLMMQTEVLTMACDPAPEFIAHLAARSLVSNRDLLRAVVREELAPGEPASDALVANAAPPLSPLYALALARSLWNPVRDRLYTTRPGIFTRHRYPAVAGATLVLRDAIDIVANESEVALSETDAFPLRLLQGVLDTNVEAQLQPRSGSLGNTADAFDTAQGWLTLAPSQRDALRDLDLPADVRRAIVEDLDRGYAVVTPPRPVTGASGEYVGWWRIDVRTGDALGVAANGWGQSMSESGVQYNVFVEMAKTFAFEYAFCHAVPQVANQAVVFLQPYRDRLPPWLPPLAQAQTAGQVYAANKKGCLIGAMIGTGVTATLPLLLIALRPAFARFLSAVGPFLRDQRGGIRIPPGLVRAQVRGGPPVPQPGGGGRAPAGRGINPFGRTAPDPSTTQLDPAAAPPAPAPPPRLSAPSTPAQAQANLRQAAANYRQALDNQLTATSDYLRYNQRNPNSTFRDWADDPGPWDPEVSEALRNEARMAKQASDEAADALKEAQRAARDAAAAARAAQGKGGFPPPQKPAKPGGCPPVCGGNNPASPGGADASAAKTSVGLGGLSGGS